MAAMTATGAARLLHAAIREAWEKPMTGGTEDLIVWTPEESKAHGYADAPVVLWESGPYEWSMCVTGGEPLLAGEFPNVSAQPQEPEILNALRRVTEAGFYFEPVNSFMLAVYPSAASS